MQKKSLFLQDRGADVAHRADVAHEPMLRSGGAGWRERVAGATEVTRTPGRGAMWQVRGCRVKGPRVGGPWGDYWGGNANVLRPCSFYTHRFPSFLPCGTMSRLIF